MPASSHFLSRERSRFGYFARRCWAEGLSKAQVSSSHGSSEALATERTYTLRTLPVGVLRGIGAALRGDPSGLLRSAAILVGLTITVCGYLRGRFKRPRR